MALLHFWLSRLLVHHRFVSCCFCSHPLSLDFPLPPPDTDSSLSTLRSAIPVFNGLVGLIGALLGAFLALNAQVSFFPPILSRSSSALASPCTDNPALQAIMYLYENRDFWKNKEKRTALAWFGVIFNIVLVLIASFIMVAGTYGSVYASPLFPNVFCQSRQKQP